MHNCNCTNYIPSLYDLVFIKDDYEVQEKAENFTILTSAFQVDGINFFATYYWPHKPKALVFISHGYGEYFSDSYDELCREMASKVRS